MFSRETYARNTHFCPFCEKNELSTYIEVKDYTVSRETFILTRCNSCGLIFTNPRPDKNSISGYYESEDYISHTNSSKGIFNKSYQLARKYSIHSKYSLVKQFSGTGSSLLDIGCGTGEFLGYCKENGFKCIGIEPSPAARKLAKDNHDLAVFDLSELAAIESATFDVITMWHVLEHVHDLKPTVQTVKRLLNPGGHYFVAVPNPESFDANHYGAFWAAYDVPRHLFHFAPDTMKKIMAAAGLQFVSSKPMKMDAYYVSLLSEKYSSGKGLGLMSALKSFNNGLLSNLKAGSAEKYSSVIYIFKKTA
jgi:2-polyprenyl-3-methyl-5-hydroxy-6-metoxy-1,4-benzoquinol methylase